MHLFGRSVRPALYTEKNFCLTGDVPRACSYFLRFDYIDPHTNARNMVH